MDGFFNSVSNDAVLDEINIETDCYQTKGAGRERCQICCEHFEQNLKIRCGECDTVLCLQCFSLGLETTVHRCYHPYRIDRRHIPVDPDTDWSLTEDADLLQGLLECGYGNYVDLNKRFMHRTVEEIRIRTDQLLGLDKAPLRACLEVEPKIVVKYQPDVISENPPRYPARSSYARFSAGYNAPRGDFDSEYNNKAEERLNNLNRDTDDEEDVDSDEELTTNLNCSIIMCYNEVLKERARRKRIIKEHALLLKQTFFSMTPHIHPRLNVFQQLLTGEDFDMLMEGFNMEPAKRRHFEQLAVYRRLGIKSLRGCKFYDKLKKMRDTAARELIRTVKPQPLQNQVVPHKKPASKLDVTQFHGYQTLSAEEKELCSVARLLPVAYLKFKAMLIELNDQEGGVRLMAARRLLKIDVNKTRKVFNYLRDCKIITAIN